MDGRKDGKTDRQSDGRTEVKQYTPPPVEQGYNKENPSLITLIEDYCRIRQYVTAAVITVYPLLSVLVVPLLWTSLGDRIVSQQLLMAEI
jgi:hypothetical protein